MTAALFVVSVCTVALGGVLVVDRIRRRARFGGAPSVGSTASTTALVGTTPDGSSRSVDLAAPGGRTLLVFLTSSCVTCRDFWAEFRGDLARGLPGRTGVLIVTEDPADERDAVVQELAPDTVPVLMSSTTWRRFGVAAAPFFVLVEGGTGRILAADTAADGAAVLRLVRSSAGG